MRGKNILPDSRFIERIDYDPCKRLRNGGTGHLC